MEVIAIAMFIAYLAAIFKSGSGSIGAGLVFAALLVALESDDWKARFPRK